MENTIQYHLAYDVFFWEEWHTKICEEGYDTPEEVEKIIDQHLLDSDSVMNIAIVKVTTTYEQVKLVKGRCKCDM